MSKQSINHENNIYAVGLNDWLFAHHISHASDLIMDQRIDDVTVIPIWQDPDHGIIVEKYYSKLVEDESTEDGNIQFQSIHESRFKDKEYPLTLIAPYNLSGKHFEVAIIELSSRHKAQKATIYNSYDTDYETLKMLIKSNLRIDLPISPFKSYSHDHEKIIGTIDGRCGDAVIAIMRLKSQGKTAKYTSLADLYQIEEDQSHSEIFDDLRNTHYLEGFIERKRARTVNNKITKNPISNQDIDDLSAAFSSKTSIKSSAPKKIEYYDDSSDEETTQNIIKSVVKKKIMALSARKSENEERKEELLRSLHHESLKILYSKEVDEYYYGARDRKGFKKTHLAIDRDYYEHLSSSIRNIMYKTLYEYSEVDSIMDTSQRCSITDSELEGIVKEMLPKKKKPTKFDNSFDPELEAFISGLKTRGGYKKISKEKQRMSSFLTNPSPAKGPTMKSKIEDLVDALIEQLHLKIDALNKGRVAKESLDLIKEEITEEIELTIKDTPLRTTLPESFGLKNKIVNGHEFIAMIRLFNRSATRTIKNLKDRQSKPLFKETRATFRSGDFNNTLSSSHFLETQEITYNIKDQRYSRRDIVNKLGSYSAIYSAIKSIQDSIEMSYAKEIADSDIAKNIRSCLKGEGIKLDKRISTEHSLQIEDFIINLTYLLFGTEAARNPSSLIIHNMMLDLIILEKESFENCFNNDKMPMSPKGAVALARMVNKEYNSLSGDDFKFQYQYPGEEKSTLKTSQRDLKSSDITDAEYNLTKEWLKLKLGNQFNKKEITTQFKEELTIAKESWLSSRVQKNIVENSTKSREFNLAKDCQESSSTSPGSSPESTSFSSAQSSRSNSSSSYNSM